MFSKLVSLYLFLFEHKASRAIKKYKSAPKSSLFEPETYELCDSITLQEQNGAFQIVDCSFKEDFPEIEKQLKEKQ